MRPSGIPGGRPERAPASSSAEEGSRYFSGELLVPDDLEIIEI